MSLRARLLLGSAVLALVLVVAGVAVVGTTRDHLVAQVDRQLRAAVPMPGGPAPRVVVPADPAADAAASDRRSPLYVAVVEGETVRPVFLPDLVGESVAVPDIDGDTARVAAITGELFTAPAPGASSYRVRAMVDPRSGVLVVSALSLDDVDAATRRLVVVVTASTLVALAVLGTVVWWVVHLGVRPVKQMAAGAARIAAGDLSHRLPASDPRTEAGQLGDALNAMLASIESAFAERAEAEARLRRFVADASHELRTPVATIRGYAELHRAGALDDPDERSEAMRRTEAEAVRMGALVDDLLTLARLDEGRGLAVCELDLAALADEAVRDARARDPKRPITFVGPDPGSGVARLVGDPDRLRQVLANLVANALVHTGQGTPVQVAVTVEGPDVVLSVHDDGPGMADDDVAHAFERFWRADPSRARSRGGAGLGLAIVAAVVEAHRGQVRLESAPGQGTTVTVRLPRTS